MQKLLKRPDLLIAFVFMVLIVGVNVLARPVCVLRGGSFQTSITGQKFCVMPAEDAGERCQNSTECKSLCVADGPAVDGDVVEFGVCYEKSTAIGCHQTVEDGMVATMCID